METYVIDVTVFNFEINHNLRGCLDLGGHQKVSKMEFLKLVIRDVESKKNIRGP